jgi:cobalt-zinc-cadmium efflux system outer membrane protein
MKKYVLAAVILASMALTAAAQTDEQIKERIRADKSLELIKKTKAEKKAEKEKAKAAKKNRNQPPVKSPDSTLILPDMSVKIPDGVNLADGLSETEAVQIALWNNAQFNTDLAQLGFARADLTQAGLLSNPVFSLLFPIGTKQLDAIFNFPFEVLWQRPRRVAAAKVNLSRIAQSLETNGLNLVRDVRLGYAELQLAEKRVQLTTNAVETRRQIPTIMEARFRFGDISEGEWQTTRADWRAFEEDRTRFEREAGALKERLRLLLGIGAEQNAFEIAPTAVVPANFTATTEDLIRQARAARPDVRAAELAIEAAGEQAKLEKRRIFNLIGSLDINALGSSPFEIGPGIGFEIPIFNRNQGNIARAYAQLDLAMRQYVLLQQQIAAEIREAQIRLGKSEELIAQLRRDVIPALEREQQIQQISFERGDIPFLFVLQNRQRLDSARIREAEAVAEKRRAQILLDRSVGKIASEQ